MEEEKEKIINQVLASQEKQLEVDAIRLVQEARVIEEKQKLIQRFHHFLIERKKQNYTIQQEEKQREEKRKYTETFRGELKEEQERKQKEKREEYKKQKQTKQMIDAYEMQQMAEGRKENYTQINSSFLQKIERTIKQWVDGDKPQKKENTAKLKIPSHQDFESKLSYQVENVPLRERKNDIKREIEEKAK